MENRVEDAPGAYVEVFVLRGCPYCIRAVSLLRQRGVQPREIDVTDDTGARAAVVERTGQRTFPQIFIGLDFVGGCDQLLRLDGDGRLSALLLGA